MAPNLFLRSMPKLFLSAHGNIYQSSTYASHYLNSCSSSSKCLDSFYLRFDRPTHFPALLNILVSLFLSFLGFLRPLAYILDQFSSHTGINEIVARTICVDNG